MRVSGTYDGESGSIAEARRLATVFLGRVVAEGAAPVPADVVGIAQLVVSELVTNAVKHVGGPCGVDLELVGDAVEIGVWDHSSQPATVMDHDPARIGRHGMEIVAALCGGFEVDLTPTGKRVTVRLSLRPAPGR
ncbi:ATP-binding protein [Streptomyces sp. NBC_01477]|uniref:ATP-binding protein n=1 Tax=Streptomyces sp. NBC_01477 TaxID=2976015 RepID=UPI002E34E416|nr:ATP-binding protein [Streptomyces sp. NBC_01477]